MGYPTNCSSNGPGPAEYLHLCQRHLKIITSSSQPSISFLPPNLVLLHHSLASWSPFFPSPLELINLQVLFYLLRTSQICSLPSISSTLFQEPSSPPCTDTIASTLSSLQPILYTLPRTTASKCKLVHVPVKLKVFRRLLIVKAMVNTNIHQASSRPLLLQAFPQAALSGLNVSPYSFV